MAKFAQYYLKYNIEHMFSFENKEGRQKHFSAFFETGESMAFVIGKGEDRKVYKHQVYHLFLNTDIIVNPCIDTRAEDEGVDTSKNVLVCLVKNDNIAAYKDRSARIYYTGRKFPSTVKLNKLYYFMPYTKRKGIRDLYLIKVARVGTKHEVRPEADENDLRLVFEIEFVKQLFDDYRPHRLKIWETFTDTTLGELM